jgi:cobyric acid synthase
VSIENQKVTQATLVTQAEPLTDQAMELIAIWDENGDPLTPAVTPADTGDTVIMTGYEAGTASAVQATDTLNEAVAKVEAQANVHDTGADVILTGYTSGSAGNVADTDTVNEAIAKLEARVYALENP